MVEGSPGTVFERFVALARTCDWKLLDDLVKALTAAHERGEVSDDEHTYVFTIVTARRRGVSPDAPPPVRARRPPDSQVGSRPRTDGSLPRRRHYLAIGLLPDAYLGAGARWGIYAVLAFIGRIVLERGRCTLFVDEIAARTGYGSSTVQEALKFGRERGWLAVQYRRPEGQRRNLANLVTVACRSWLLWLRARVATWRGVTRNGRAFWGIGSNFPGATRTREKSGVGLTTDSTIERASPTPGRAPGGSKARTGPSRPPRLAPA